MASPVKFLKCRYDFPAFTWPCLQISVEEPWTSPDAAYLDSISVKEWVQTYTWTR